jgi:hypothetical protein
MSIHSSSDETRPRGCGLVQRHHLFELPPEFKLIETIGDSEAIDPGIFWNVSEELFDGLQLQVTDHVQGTLGQSHVRSIEVLH